MPARLVLWRHGQTDWNVAGRFQGRHDVALNDVGRAQAAAAAPRLAALGLTRVVASPLVRAHETACVLASRCGLEVVTDDRLVEVHVGEWEGLTAAEIGERCPDFLTAPARGVDMVRGATGECDMDVAARMGVALREIAAQGDDGEVVAVVTHGLAMKMGACALLGWDFHASRQLAIARNCAWAELDPLADGGWRLRSWNVTADAAVDPIQHPRV